MCFFFYVFSRAADQRSQKAAPWISRRSNRASLPMLISWREGKDLKKESAPFGRRGPSWTKLIWNFICSSISLSFLLGRYLSTTPFDYLILFSLNCAAPFNLSTCLAVEKQPNQSKTLDYSNTTYHNHNPPTRKLLTDSARETCLPR